MHPDYAHAPKTFSTNPAQAQQHADTLNNAPTLAPPMLSENQQQKISLANDPLNFNVDDITGDVNHIQSSLDNIRDFMFDNMPEDATLDELFGDDHALLSPLLHAAEMADQSSNLFLPNLQEQKPVTLGKSTISIVSGGRWIAILYASLLGNNQNDPAPLSSQSVPTMNDQLFEQLIHESAKVEEQRQAINQLEREKSDLKDKIHVLEQKTTKK